MNIKGHFETITRHKLLVMKYCRKNNVIIIVLYRIFLICVLIPDLS